MLPASMAGAELLEKRLSFALRFDNHFTGAPITTELAVRLARSFERPVASPSGALRQADGTYRFVDVSAGSHTVLWSPPLTSATAEWTTWGAPVVVDVPRTTPADVVAVDVWPTTAAPIAPQTTALRIKLVGPDVGDRRVEIEASGAPPTGRFTRSDANGELVFLVTQSAPVTATGTITLVAAVVGATVAGGSVDGSSFVGDTFSVQPSRQSRVVLTIG